MQVAGHHQTEMVIRVCGERCPSKIYLSCSGKLRVNSVDIWKLPVSLHMQHNREFTARSRTDISRMKGVKLLASLLAISYGHASETVFSVNDDVLAFPQVPSQPEHYMSLIDHF